MKIFITLLCLIGIILSQQNVFSQKSALISCADINALVPCPGPLNTIDKPGWFVVAATGFCPTEYHLNPMFEISTDHPPTCYDDYGDCQWFFGINPQNVTFTPCTDNPEQSKSGNYQANLWNTANESPSGCVRSGCEIKTFDACRSEFKQSAYSGWGYMEARVKLFKKSGMGAAMWLRGLIDKDDPVPDAMSGRNEIDVFETRGMENNGFDVTYKWPISINDETEESHTVFLSFSDPYLGRIPYDLTSNWTTFGIEWSHDFIKWYVNNTLIHELDMNCPVNQCVSKTDHYFPPDFPFYARYNVGSNHVGNHPPNPPGPNEFPQNYQIDYVRIYMKEGAHACPISSLDHDNSICISANSSQNSNKILKTNFYPDASYTWTSNYFNFEPWVNPYHQPALAGKMKVWIKPNSGVQPNNSYPIQLIVTFPWGHTETNSFNLYVVNNLSTPIDHFQASQVQSGACLFEISNKLSADQCVGCMYNDGGEWSTGQVKTHPGWPGKYCFFGGYDPNSPVSFDYKENNACGESPVIHKDMQMPQPPPGCRQAPVHSGLPNTVQDNSLQINIYPNPIANNIDIELNNIPEADGCKYSLSVYGIIGNSLFQLPLKKGLNEISVTNLLGGIYYIVIKRACPIFS